MDEQGDGEIEVEVCILLFEMKQKVETSEAEELRIMTEALIMDHTLLKWIPRS